MLAAFLVCVLNSCDKGDDFSIHESSISVHIGDIHSISFTGDIESVVIKNKFIATWDNRTKSIKGVHAGNTEVVFNNSVPIPVKVQGDYELEFPPYFSWGEDITTFRPYLKELYIGNEYMEILPSSIGFYNKSKEEVIYYFMENWKLKYIVYFIGKNRYGFLGNYLSERFTLAPSSDSNEDNEILVSGYNAYNYQSSDVFCLVTTDESYGDVFVVMFIHPDEVFDRNRTIGISRNDGQEFICNEAIKNVGKYIPNLYRAGKADRP